MERISKSESKLELSSVSITYLENIEDMKNGQPILEPYYYFDNLSKILEGFNEDGFYPKDDKLKRQVRKILRSKEDFPIKRLDNMGIARIGYNDPSNPGDYSKSAFLSYEAYVEMEKPLQILKTTEVKDTFSKII